MVERRWVSPLVPQLFSGWFLDWMLLECCFDCCLVLLVGGGDEVCGGLEKVGYDSNFFEKDNDEQ